MKSPFLVKDFALFLFFHNFAAVKLIIQDLNGKPRGICEIYR